MTDDVEPFGFSEHARFDSDAAALPTARLSAAAKARHRSLLAGLPIEAPTATEPRRQVSRSPGRRRALVIAMVLGLTGAGVGTAGALGVFSAPPTDRRVAHCYPTAELGDERMDFAVAPPPDGSNPSLVDAATSALEICAGAWMQERLSPEEPRVRLDPGPPPWDNPVPPLVACVLESGEVGVFPGGTDLCGQLELPVAKI